MINLDLYQELLNESRSSHHVQLSQHARSKERQTKKYERLSAERFPGRADTSWRSTTHDSKGEVNELWLKNLSKSRELTENELSVLVKGTNFSVARSKALVVEYITATESAIYHGKLPAGVASGLREDVSLTLRNFKPPKEENLTKGEKEALETLSKDKSIMLLPADKGSMMVVMDTDERLSSVIATLMRF